MSSNDVSLETFQNNKKKLNVLMYVIIGLILIGIGASLASQQTSFGIVGGLACIGGGGYSVYYGYEELVDPRNERRANLEYFNQQSCVVIPKEYLKEGADIDVVLDKLDTELLIKAEYEGYGGIYLKSNTSTDSIGGTFDGFFLPKGTKVHKVIRADASTTGDNYGCFLFTVKKGDNAVTLRDSNGNKLANNLKCSPQILPNTCKVSIGVENA